MHTKIRPDRSEHQWRLECFLRIVNSEGLNHNVIKKGMIS